MKPNSGKVLLFASALLAAWTLEAQVTLNFLPSRALGHPRLAVNTASPTAPAWDTFNPNLVEGREFYSPQSVALDTSVTPPILYVSDKLNNRVLAWKNASSFANGAPADLVIGQKDKLSTFFQGPGGFAGGLMFPSGVAVDKDGNLFVADSGNSRILRYPRPFQQQESPISPDLVIGQPNLSSRAPNAGGRSSSTLMLNSYPSSSEPQYSLRAALLFDSEGNLWVTDTGNSRVLRYPAWKVATAARDNGPSADLVLGQVDFESAPQSPSQATDLTRLIGPVALALDSGGRLYVADGAQRVVVYTAPFANGKPGTRHIGGVLGSDGRALNPPTQRSLNSPQGLIVVNSNPYVLDTGNNRVLRYDPYDNWPVGTPPDARFVLGQDTFAGNKPNRGGPKPTFDAFYLPFAAAFGGQNELFLVDTGNHRVLVFPDPTSPPAFQAKRVLGQLGFDLGAPNLVEGREFYLYDQSLGGGGGIAVDNRSTPPHLYVSDTFNNRILCFRDAWKVKAGDKADLVIGQADNQDFFHTLVNYPTSDTDIPTASSLFWPAGLAVDANGNLYVADRGNGRVLRFPRPFDQAPGATPAANLVLGKRDFITALVNAPNASASNMGAPYGLAFTVDGHLLVSDTAFHRVLFFRKPGSGDFTNGMSAEKVFGQPDFLTGTSVSGDNRFRGPRHIATDTSDRMYVCDTGNNRVMIFDRVTTAQSDPTPTKTLSGLSSPQGIYVSPLTGHFYVANTAASTVLRYSEYLTLFQNPNPTKSYASAAPLTVVLDGSENMIVAESFNRLAFYYPAMVATNGASFLIASPDQKRDSDGSEYRLQRRLAPGAFSTLFSMTQATEPWKYGLFGDVTQSFNDLPNPLPVPKTLGGLQVLVDGQAAPMFYTSPNQINFLMPMNAPVSGAVNIQVVRASTGQILAAGLIMMNTAAPALFQTEMLQQSPEVYLVAANNVKVIDEKTQERTPNSIANPVEIGQAVELYGTGAGYFEGVASDMPPGPGKLTNGKPTIMLGSKIVPDGDIEYSGLAPDLVGLWQINLRIRRENVEWLGGGSPRVRLTVIYQGILSTNPPGNGRVFYTEIAIKQ